MGGSIKKTQKFSMRKTEFCLIQNFKGLLFKSLNLRRGANTRWAGIIGPTGRYKGESVMLYFLREN